MTEPNDLTALSDQTNVDWTFVPDEEPGTGYTPSEIDAILRVPRSGVLTAAGGTVQPQEDPVYDLINGGSDTVPWRIVENSSKCSGGEPYAVVKETDGEVEGCHATRAEATAQLRALYASESKSAVESVDTFDATLTETFASDRNLREYWVHGEGALKIRWGTPGDFERCVKQLDKYVRNPEGLCAEYHKEATGKSPHQHPGTPTESVEEQTFADMPVDAPAGGDCPEGQHMMPDGTCMKDSEMPAYGSGVGPWRTEQPKTMQDWEGVLAVEGVETGDGRMFAEDSLTWPVLPVPLMFQRVTSHGGGTDESVNVGNITEIWRDGAKIMGRGTLDMIDPNGQLAEHKLRGGFFRGVSIDADSVKDADVELVFPAEPEDATDDEIMAAMLANPELMIFHAGRIRGATLVNLPAFVEASINLVDDGVIVASAESNGVIVADGSHTIVIPDLPPMEWFEEPSEMPPIGAVWITDEGRIFGMVGPSDVAHRSFRDKKITIPMGNVDYTSWMNRPFIVEGGHRIRTGVITMDCGHMSAHASADPVIRMSHYDNSCSIAAVVCVGESKKHGVPWVAGTILPMSAEQLQRFMGCQLSGDWAPHRERRGWKEFVAALAVPVPGFARSTDTVSVRVEDSVVIASAVPIKFWENGGDDAVYDDAPTDEVVTASAESIKSHRQQLAEIRASLGVDNRQTLASIRDRVRAGGETQRPSVAAGRVATSSKKEVKNVSGCKPCQRKRNGETSAQIVTAPVPGIGDGDATKIAADSQANAIANASRTRQG